MIRRILLGNDGDWRRILVERWPGGRLWRLFHFGRREMRREIGGLGRGGVGGGFRRWRGSVRCRFLGRRAVSRTPWLMSKIEKSFAIVKQS